MSLENKVNPEKVDRNVKRAIELLKEIPERRKECEEEGHKEIGWLPHFISNRGNNNQRRGLCQYCHTWVTRPLNDEERKNVREFYRDLQRPIYR